MSDPSPGSEGYWNEIADGGSSIASPTEILQAELDEDDRVHSVVVTGRTDDELYLLVSRSTTHDDGRDVIDLRTFVVDLSSASGWFTGNGVWVPATNDVATALTRAIVRTGNDYPEDTGSASLLVSGLEDGDEDPTDRGRELMTEPVDELLEDESEPQDFSKVSVEDDSVETVTCSDCGAEIPKEDAVNFGGGVVDVWVHEGDCPGDQT